MSYNKNSLEIKIFHYLLLFLKKLNFKDQYVDSGSIKYTLR